MRVWLWLALVAHFLRTRRLDAVPLIRYHAGVLDFLVVSFSTAAKRSVSLFDLCEIDTVFTKRIAHLLKWVGVRWVAGG